MQKLFFICLLFGLTGCKSEPPPKLSDAKFIDLFSDVMDLHRRYPFDPDSLYSERKMLFKRHGVTSGNVAQFLKDRQNHPESWAPIIAQLQKKYGNDIPSQLRNFEKTPSPSGTKKTEQQ